MKKKYTFEEVWELAPYLNDKELLDHLERVDDVMALAKRKNDIIRKRGETIWGQNDWTKKEEERRIDNDRLQIQRIIRLLHLEAQPNNAIPDCLKNQRAEASKAKALKGGLLNKDWTLTDLVKTKALAALLAEYLSDDIGLTTIIKEEKGVTKKRRSYKPFEKLWGYTGFSQQRSKDQIKNTQNGHLVINAFK